MAAELKLAGSTTCLSKLNALTRREPTAIIAIVSTVKPGVNHKLGDLANAGIRDVYVQVTGKQMAEYRLTLPEHPAQP